MDHESISDNQDVEDGEVSFIDFELQRKSSSFEVKNFFN